MKNIFNYFYNSPKKSSKRLVNTALNRDRLIRFSHKLRESTKDLVIEDFSVDDDSPDNKESLTNQSKRSPTILTN
jgi:hypothetical protein